jgi:hypothetical protein
MTDISITAANVVAGAGAAISNGIAGATITAGAAVYLDAATTGKWQLADSDAASAAARGQSKIGIALNGAALNQPIAVQTEGKITIGGTLVAGTVYVLSDEPGGICPQEDLGEGDYVTIVGVAESTSILALAFKYSGVATPPA